MLRIKSLPLNHPQEMRVSGVQYLSEQDGPPERLLKNRLSEFFQRDKRVQRDFLAKVSLDGQAGVALCIKTQFDADRGLSVKKGRIDGLIVNADQKHD